QALHPLQHAAGALVAGLGGRLHLVAVGGDQGELGGDESAAGHDQHQADRQGDEGTDQVHGRISPWEVNECRPEGLGLSLGASLAALMISWCSSRHLRRSEVDAGMLQPAAWEQEPLWRARQRSAARRCRNAATARSSISSTACPSCGRRSSSSRVWALRNSRTASSRPSAKYGSIPPCPHSTGGRSSASASSPGIGPGNGKPERFTTKPSARGSRRSSCRASAPPWEKPIAPTTGAVCCAIQLSTAAAEVCSDSGRSGSIGISNQA